MADQSVKQGAPVQAPRHGVNAFQIAASPTEVTLLCLSQVMGMNEEGQFDVGSLPSVMLGMSPLVTKELSVLLADVVEKHEQQFGELTSPFLKEFKGGAFKSRA